MEVEEKFPWALRNVSAIGSGGGAHFEATFVFCVTHSSETFSCHSSGAMRF